MGDTGTPSTLVSFTVELEIDNEVWQANYGTTGSETSQDIRRYMRNVIDELVRNYLDTSGNEGLVNVIAGDPK